MPNSRAWPSGEHNFFTAALADPHSALLTRHIRALGAAVREVQRLRRFRIDAFVVLPDHLHVIATVPRGCTPMAAIWHAIEAVFAREVAREGRHDNGDWQRGWEYRSFVAAELPALIDRIHIDPVRHGFVTRAAFWPWSSFHRYVCAGLYGSDWPGRCVPAELPPRRLAESKSRYVPVWC